jgi:tetratricopeptide (TPR) repeat protein
VTRRELAIALLLAAVTAAVYAPQLGHGFIDLDDGYYVTENARVQGGLTLDGVRWAFTTFNVGNWHPLAWLSHMLDWQLFGPWAGGHHATSLLLHALNAALLFWALRELTRSLDGALWPCAFAAALFALHPLGVESVAWVAERKSLLSTLFGLIALGAYGRYVRTRSAAAYAALAVGLGLSLMAKPMLVTLPFALLLLDYWPLARSEQPARRVREKLPLFALVAASCAVTLLAQTQGGFVARLESYSLAARIANAPVAYVQYLLQALWPTELAIYYPHPGLRPLWQPLAATVALSAISGGAFAARARHPALLVGWLWYLGTLVPVIGLVQVGSQAMADRYTYIPLIGLFVAAAWELPKLLPGLPRRREILTAAAALVLLALGAATRVQLGYWGSEIALFERALRAAGPSALAHHSLGNSLQRAGRLEEALPHYRASLALYAANPELLNSLGVTLQRLGRIDEAIRYYRAALRLDPMRAHVRFNLGLAYAEQGLVGAAVAEWREVARRHPSHLGARIQLGITLAQLGRNAEAARELSAALALLPSLANPGQVVRARNALGSVLAMQGRLDRAIEQFELALEVDPGQAELHYNLANALSRRGELDAAATHYGEALRLDPGHHRARNQLELLRTRQPPGG